MISLNLSPTKYEDLLEVVKYAVLVSSLRNDEGYLALSEKTLSEIAPKEAKSNEKN